MFNFINQETIPEDHRENWNILFKQIDEKRVELMLRNTRITAELIALRIETDELERERLYYMGAVVDGIDPIIAKLSIGGEQ